MIAHQEETHSIPSMRSVKLTIEYDGTNYAGWQVQPNGPSIQAAIEAAIKQLTGEDVRLAGAGRTDAGVHALGQVATFRTGSSIPADNFALALNSRLPKDIAIRDSQEVHDSFDPRREGINRNQA